MARLVAVLMVLGILVGLCAGCGKPKPPRAEISSFVSACEKGNLSKVKASFEKYSSEELVKAEDKDGRPAINLAAGSGNIGVVKELIANGAEVNVTDGAGPLSAAAIGGDVDMARLLIEKGADVDAKDKEGHTALHFAATMRHKSVVELLIDKGADVNAKTKDGYTPLFYARFIWAPGLGGDEEVPLILVRNGGK